MLYKTFYFKAIVESQEDAEKSTGKSRAPFAQPSLVLASCTTLVQYGNKETDSGNILNTVFRFHQLCKYPCCVCVCSSMQLDHAVILYNHKHHHQDTQPSFHHKTYVTPLPPVSNPWQLIICSPSL